MNIPNFLTFSRILTVTPLIWLHNEGHFLWAFGLGLFSVLTDFFDGRIARKLNQCTYFGAILDPVADKFFEIALLSYFWHRGELPLFFLVLFSTRNILQLSTIPVLMWWLKIPFKVEPAQIAKWGSAVPATLIMILFAKKISWLSWGEFTISPLIVISTLIEVYMLATFVPRYRLVLLRKHDTFN